ncbi:hypothetical protein M1D93_10790 [Arthrobacter sp. Z1-9]
MSPPRRAWQPWVKAVGTPQEVEPTAVSRSVAPEYEGDRAIPAPQPLKHSPPVGVVAQATTS